MSGLTFHLLKLYPILIINTITFRKLWAHIFLDLLLKALDYIILSDYSYSHDTIAGKDINSFLSFAAKMPVEWGAQWQASSREAVHGAKLSTLKLAIKRDVAARLHLRAIG